MIQSSKHTLICVPCGGFIELPSYMRLPDFIREHRNKHLQELRSHASTVTVLFDGSSDSDFWLNLLLTWRLERGKANDVPSG